MDLKFYIKLERLANIIYRHIVSSEAVENYLFQHISTYLFKIYIYHGLWAYTFIM